MGLSPTSGSVLTAQRLKPASDSVSPSVSAPSLLMLCLSKNEIKLKKKFFLRTISLTTTCNAGPGGLSTFWEVAQWEAGGAAGWAP